MSDDPFRLKMQNARVMLSEHLGLPMLAEDLQLRETVPLLDQTVFDFCRAAGIERPMPINVTPADGAEPGWCIRNVRRAIEQRGGTVVHGWLIWGAPGLFYEAEFHAVLRDLEGHLVDVTPTQDGETLVLFSPDARYPESFDFMQRPGNKRIKIHRRPDLDARIAERLASMSEASLRYEGERARRKGMQLRDWVASRIGPDAFDLAIDRFISLADKLDTMIEPVTDGVALRKGLRSADFERIKEELLAAKLKVWMMAEGAVMQRIAATSGATSHGSMMTA